MRPNRKPPLTVAQTLSWADSHRARTGEWPGAQSGHVLDNRNEKWVNVNQALRLGLSGLRGDGIARLLDRERGKCNVADLPGLTEGQIATGQSSTTPAPGGGRPRTAAPSSAPAARSGRTSTRPCAKAAADCPVATRSPPCWPAGWACATSPTSRRELGQGSDGA